jgi:hypothetical protein
MDWSTPWTPVPSAVKTAIQTIATKNRINAYSTSAWPLSSLGLRVVWLTVNSGLLFQKVMSGAGAETLLGVHPVDASTRSR